MQASATGVEWIGCVARDGLTISTTWTTGSALCDEATGVPDSADEEMNGLARNCSWLECVVAKQLGGVVVHRGRRMDE